MSIKQGEYLRKLRIEREFSQEQLAEAMRLSRQSISKWEQGVSTPDIDNFMKPAEFYSVPIESLIKAEKFSQKPESAEENSVEEKPEKKKPIIFCYPVLVVIIYLLCGILFKLWHPMWIVFLTIPLFYIITAKMKK